MVNEIVRWYKLKKMLLFKVDFEKAYDSVSWEYLDKIMEVMGCGEKWRRWIKDCLQSARSSVLLNGNPTTEFQLQRGLRQGDPLSSFLFILIMEGLRVCMEDATHNSIFKGVTIGEQNLHISHLFYADDASFLENGILRI